MTDNIRLQYALGYAEIGWRVLPCWWIENGACACGKHDCASPGKHPIPALAPHGQKDATVDAGTISAWWQEFPDANIAISMAASGLVAVDMDPRNGGDLGLEQLEALHGKLATDVEQWSGGGGSHWIFTLPDNCGALPGKLAVGVDLKANGYLMVEPSNHISGGTYEWADESSPLEGHIPGPLPDWIRDLGQRHSGSDGVSTRERFVSSEQITELASALTALDADDRDTWIRVGMCLRECGEAGFRIWDEWSKTSPKYKPGECRRKWMRDIKPGKGLSFESVFKIAQDGGWKNPGSTKNDEDYDFGGTLSAIIDSLDNEPTRSYQRTEETDFVVGNVTIKRVSSYATKNTEWIWPKFLVRGKIINLAGPPGTGKSTWAFKMAAAVSSGGLFPDGHQAEEGIVLLWSSEDDMEDTIKPRMEAMGANLDNVFNIESTVNKKTGKKEHFHPARHMEDLLATCAEVRPTLLIIDSIADTIGKGKSSNDNNDVREALLALNEIAQRIGMCVLGIAHFTKGSQGRDPLDRIAGSVAFGGVARGNIICINVRGDENKGKKLVTRKYNNEEDGNGFDYRMERHELALDTGEIINTVRIAVDGEFSGDAQTIVDEADGFEQAGGRRDKPKSKSDEAIEFILSALSNGPMSASDMESAAADEFISAKTLRDARDKLKEKGMILNGRCKETRKHFWYLPGNVGSIQFM